MKEQNRSGAEVHQDAPPSEHVEGPSPFHTSQALKENTAFTLFWVVRYNDNPRRDAFQRFRNPFLGEALAMKKHSAYSSHGNASSAVSWHALYQAALFETDRNLIPQRIAKAEKAILDRVKELFHVNTDHIEEDQVLDDALYALRALRNCVVSEANAA